MNKIAKKTVKIFGRIGLVLLGMLVLLLFAASSPLLQTQVVNRFLARQSEKLGISAQVQRVNIDFFSRQVKVSGIIIYDHHQNLLFDAGSVQTSLRDFSTQHLNLGATYIYDVVFRLHRYEEDSVSNLQLIFDALGLSEDTTTSDFAFRTSAVFLRNMEFSFVDEVYSQGDTFRFIDFNNLFLSNINLTARNLHILGDNILATIENLSFKEQGGFEVWRFSSRANVSPRGIIARNTDIITSNSDLDLDIRFTTQSWDDYQDFLSNVRIYANIRDSYLDFKDLIHFAPGLQGKQNQFHISGSILGHVDNFRAHDFRISYGRSTKFHGDVSMVGLPDFDETFLDFSIQNLTTSPEDLDGFLLPNFGKIIVPDELHNVGLSSLSGKIIGFPSDLRATIDLTTEAGDIQTNFRFFHDTLRENFDFSGQIEHANLALGVLLNDNALGNNLGLNGSFDGKFSAENGIDFSTNLVLRNVEYKNRQVNTISIKGDWVGHHIAAVVSITDYHGAAGFSGELSLDPKNPYLNIGGSFNDVDLTEFVFLNDTSPALLSFDFSGKLYSLNIDSLIGNLNFSDLNLALSDTTFQMSTLTISQEILPQGISTKINCDYFSMDVLGNHRLSNLDAIWNDIQKNYLSALRFAVKDVESLTSQEIHARNISKNGVHPVAQTLDLTLNVYRTGGFLSYFLPGIDLPRGANLRLEYNGEYQPLSLTVRANHATLYGFYTSLLDIRGDVQDSVFQVSLDARNIHINNSRYFDDFSLIAGFESDFVSWELDWIGTSNGDRQINGNLGGRMTTLENNSISFNIQNSELFLGDQSWQFDPNNSIFIDSIGVRFENIRFYNQNDTLEYLSLNGDLSREPNSILELSFERYQLSPWAPMIERIGLDFDGMISGDISIFDFYTTLRFDTDLKIEDFSINGFNYGTAFLRAIAEDGAARSFINFNVHDNEKTYLSANGYFYSVGDERNLDFNISVSDMDLSLLKNYVETFSSSLTGKFSGELTLDGLLRSPNFYGDLTLDGAVMKIDFLNTYYAINPEQVAFSLDSIIFINTNLEDIANQTQATLSGGLYHNRFDNFQLDINIETTNFLALNTTRLDNEDFFGRVFLTGNVNLNGPVEDILIDVQGRTERGTELQINYSSRVNISEANPFIHFVAPEKTKNVDEEDFFTIANRATADLDVPTNIMVRLNIDVTPDASVFFDMDAPPISGLIHAQGSGSLRMNFDSRTQEFTLFGNYVLQDGFYDFMFEDPALGLGRLITRRFYIERGGTLQWTGDPGNMILDISAIYSTRASLAPVFANQLSTSGNTMRRVGVQSVISLVGRMSQPDIRFDFRLPAVDENTRTEFFTAINRDDENEMMRQTFFLLLFGGFTTPGDNLASAENISGEAMAWNALLNQANNMLNFGNNINLSASYRPEDIHSTEQWQVSMGAQFLDNRLLIEGHVGQGGLAHHLTEHSSQTIMELNVEYRLTDRLSLRVFNRPNERDFVRGAQMGYSQGAGIAYRREFGSFRSLFARRRREE